MLDYQTQLDAILQEVCQCYKNYIQAMEEENEWNPINELTILLESLRKLDEFLND